MFTARQMRNKPLINITDGKHVGTIEDLYLDKSLEMVKAVFLGSEGFITRRSHVVDLEAVQVCGADAWLVRGADKVLDLDQYPEAESMILAGDLKGREIQTDGGTKIGTVDDVILDPEAKVIGFTLGRVHVHGPLAERRQIARAAISNVGSQGQPMIAQLETAESVDVPER
jgi:sporulation protein YlmC with PRC-barrel domain